MNDTVTGALNDQIQAEFFSFYLYLAVAAYFKGEHLDGFAHWMRVQAYEEFGHAMKLFDFVTERGAEVRLLPLEAPRTGWASPSAAVSDVLEHERHISDRIDSLVNQAEAHKDHATAVFLHWYVNEQVEEVATADTLYHQVKMVEDSPQGLLMLDRELAARPAAPGPVSA